MPPRPISTFAHGVIDYVTAPSMLATPTLLRLGDEAASALILRAAGGGAALYSSMTDYELGVDRRIPMRVHLALDAASGAMLAASPWLFGFARAGARHWLPHVFFGLGEIAAAALTEPEPPRAARLRRLADAAQRLLR